jgi:hypothetical protein
MRTEKVFIVFFSQGTNRPFIEHELNRHVDWVALDEFADGTRPLEAYKPIELIVDDPDATKCDFYICDGTHNMFSTKAVEVLGEAAFKNYRLLPAKVNGAPYVILSQSLAEIDCFDREHATYVDCEPPEKLMFSIAKFAFFPEKIDPDYFFSIPESRYLLCSQVLADPITRELSGIGLIEVFNVRT